MSWKLENPFLKPDGTLIQSPEEWPEQQTYIKEVLAHDFYGEMPEAPGNIKAEKLYEKELWDGKDLFEVYDLSFGPENMVHEKTVVIRGKSSKPIPVVMAAGYVDEDIAKLAVSQGFSIITMLFDEAAPDSPDYQEGTLYKAYPDAGFKVIGMWGWLMSRVIDWLIEADFTDNEHIVVAGHSRYGKAALACAVYDTRVYVCAAGGSGCGGIGSLRVAGGRFGKNNGDVETLGNMISVNFPHWFVDSLVPYGARDASKHYKENELRFDANFIGAAIAPRALILPEGLDDTWANPYGTLASWSATAEVYHFLGAAQKCALHEREGGHALNLEDWTAILDFCKVQIFGAQPKVSWHTRSEGDPIIERDWFVDQDGQICLKIEPDEDVLYEDEISAEENSGQKATFSWPTMTWEQINAMKANISNRWAFSDAGLETGMVKFIRGIIERAEAALEESSEEQSEK